MAMKLGIVIAGVLVLALVAFVVLRVVFPSPHDPTGATLKRGVLDLKTVKVSVAEVLGAEPSGAGNAGDDYAQAVQLAKQKTDELDPLRDEEKLEQLADGALFIERPLQQSLESIYAHVRNGAAKKDMNYVLVHTPKKLETAYYQSFVTDLARVGAALDVLGKFHLGRKKLPEAEQVFKAKATLGWHMVGERALPAMVHQGLQIQYDALFGLNDVYLKWDEAHKSRIDSLQRYADGLKAAERSYNDKAKIVWVVRPKPGDIFNIIENDEDLAWRRQGTLALGIVKFYSKNHRGDSRYTRKLIDENLNSSDPITKAAAQAANDLTYEQYVRLGTQF